MAWWCVHATLVGVGRPDLDCQAPANMIGVEEDDTRDD